MFKIITPEYTLFITDNEWTNLRRRNAIAYSLQMGKTYSEISKTLRVSNKTIAKVKKMMDGDL